MTDVVRGFEDVSRKQAFGLSICKIHMYLPANSQLAASMLASGQALAVYIYRHPLDMAASMKRFRPDTFWEKDLLDITRVHRLWTGHKNVYVSKYDDVVNDIAGEALKIAYFLGLPLSEDMANDIAFKLSIKNQKQRMPSHGLNKKDWLWNNHIFTGENGLWQSELTSGEIARVRHSMSDIIKEYENN
jgi:hypothetical protein